MHLELIKLLFIYFLMFFTNFIYKFSYILKLELTDSYHYRMNCMELKMFISYYNQYCYINESNSLKSRVRISFDSDFTTHQLTLLVVVRYRYCRVQICIYCTSSASGNILRNSSVKSLFSSI